MVKTTRPIDGDIRFTLCKFVASNERTCCIPLTILVHVVKHGTVIVCGKVLANLVGEMLLLLDSDILEGIDVVIAVEVSEIDIVNKCLINSDLVHLR